MVEKPRLQCPSDNYDYSQQRKQKTFLRVFANSGNNAERWHTSSQDAYCRPEVEETRNIGRRKDLVRKVLSEQVLQKIADEKNPREVVDDGINPSEYFDNFCDSQFTPMMDQPEAHADNFVKYPLYTCNNRTLYKEQVERGSLKTRSEIANLNEPFRRNCAFTTSPDQALREPTGGY